MLTAYWNRNVNPWSAVLRDIDDVFNSLPMPARELREYDPNLLTPAYDIDENDDYYMLSFDIPGIGREDLSVEMIGNKLTVSGERKSEGKAAGRRFGKFQQVFTLPEGVPADAVQADCRDGVLRLAIPKPTAAKPTKISVGDGAGKAGGFLKTLLGEKKASKESLSARQTSEPVAMAN